MSLKSAYMKAYEVSSAQEQRNKSNFDLKVKVQDLQPVDHVLLRNLGVTGRHKLAGLAWVASLSNSP